MYILNTEIMNFTCLKVIGIYILTGNDNSRSFGKNFVAIVTCMLSLPLPAPTDTWYLV